MPSTLTTLLHRLRVLSAPPRLDSDAELLGRFARLRDEGAFAALVGRHGPMVLNACRRVPGETDAEDAFQATFLVLEREPGAWSAIGVANRTGSANNTPIRRPGIGRKRPRPGHGERRRAGSGKTGKGTGTAGEPQVFSRKGDTPTSREEAPEDRHLRGLPGRIFTVR